MLNLLSIWIQNDYHNFSFIMAIRTQITYLFILFLYSYDTFFLFIFLFSTVSFTFLLYIGASECVYFRAGKKWKEMAPLNGLREGDQKGVFLPDPHPIYFRCALALGVVAEEIVQSSCCEENSRRRG